MMDLTSLEPVERRSTAAIVADRLREAIMRGTFPPGTQLGEVEIATRLGVSRGPLREAMQWLVAEGLLRSVRNRGLFVRDLDAADVRDVYAARAAVERAAGLLLIAGDREAAVARLSASLAAMEAAAGDPVALADADHAFHHELVAASGSPRLQRMADTLLVETRMCLAALQDNPPPAADLLAEHRALLAAVRDGDAEKLTRVLEAHMADAVDRILAPVAVATTPVMPPGSVPA
jgi:DNA-binding GntR family transcriptional regulator